MKLKSFREKVSPIKKSSLLNNLSEETRVILTPIPAAHKKQTDIQTPKVTVDLPIREVEPVSTNHLLEDILRPKFPDLTNLKIEQSQEIAKTDILPKKEDLMKQTINALSDQKQKTKSLQQTLQNSELDGLKKQVAGLVQKVGTLSWGSGGSGSVKIGDMADFNHQSVVNGEGKFLQYQNGKFTLNTANGNSQDDYARSFANTANTNALNAYGTANAAYTQANNSYIEANLAFNAANSIANGQTSLSNVDHITFNSNGPSITPQAGSLSWNPSDSCLDIYQPDGTVLQTGLENYIRVKNNSGNTLNSGVVVSFGGIDVDNPVAIPALANNTYLPIYTIGVLTENIESGNTGRATVFGKVREIDTTGSLVGEVWSVGDILFIHPTQAGKLTKDQPTAPDVAVVVAAVIKVGTNDGELLVRPTITPRLYYGSFSDTTTQNCANSNTATAVTFNTTDFSSGHVVVTYNGVANSAIKALNHGLYNYQFSLQIQSTSSSRAQVWIWARKNGINISNSATKISVESNGGVMAPAWNFIVSMQPNDVFQLMWATDSHTKINMVYETPTTFCPEIPSALISVSQVNQ